MQEKLQRKPWTFDPKDHEYTEHPTYTGPGCAHCGKPKEVHQFTNDSERKEKVVS